MMGRSAVLTLAVRSIMSRRTTAGLTILAIALSVALFAGVEKMRQGVRTGFERTISGTDLIVGARSGPINLVLYSVFRLGDPTNNMTWQSYREIAERPEVAWTVPLSLGDSHRGFRVIGTTPAYFEHYRFGNRRTLTFARGRPFDDIFEAVIGADVARALGYEVGQEIVISHGLGAVSFSKHDDKPFKVAGILEPTGTPVDRSVHVSLAGIEAIHLGWESGVQTPQARAVTADDVRAMTLQPKAITAALVGLKSRVGVFRLQRHINTYRSEPLLAVIPGVALGQLWSVVSVAERALSGISLFVVAVGLVGILTSILTSLNERRREMAVLRAVGARPRDIFILLVSEAGLLALAGSLSGLAVLHGGLVLAAPVIQSQFGIAVGGLGPALFDLWVVLGVTGASLILGAVPAWRAFRTSLADGLAIKF